MKNQKPHNLSYSSFSGKTSNFNNHTQQSQDKSNQNQNSQYQSTYLTYKNNNIPYSQQFSSKQQQQLLLKPIIKKNNLIHNQYAYLNQLYKQNGKIKILTFKRDHSVKSIQNILQKHKRNVQFRFQTLAFATQKTSRQKLNLKQQLSSKFNNTSLRNSRLESIQTSKIKMLNGKRQSFSLYKKFQSQYHIKAAQQKSRIFIQNLEKRNTIRQMEKLSQTKVEKFWDDKVQTLRNLRKQQVDRKIKKNENIKINLDKLKKHENKLKSQIDENKQMRQKIQDQIKAENKMSNKCLASLYKNRNKTIQINKFQKGFCQSQHIALRGSQRNTIKKDLKALSKIYKTKIKFLRV